MVIIEPSRASTWRVGRARRAGGRFQLEVGDDQFFGELRAAGQLHARAASTMIESPSNTSSSWPPIMFHVGQHGRAPPRRPLRSTSSSRVSSLPRLVRRGVGHHEQARARRPGRRRPGPPSCHRSSQIAIAKRSGPSPPSFACIRTTGKTSAGHEVSSGTRRRPRSSAGGAWAEPHHDPGRRAASRPRPAAPPAGRPTRGASPVSGGPGTRSPPRSPPQALGGEPLRPWPATRRSRALHERGRAAPGPRPGSRSASSRGRPTSLAALLGGTPGPLDDQL